jgi:6,7-dimethyl-8-ribityllumazine synthase
MNQKGNDNLNNIITGIPTLADACIVIVKTEWNHTIADALENSCIHTLKQYGVTNIITYTVPGAFEIPFAIRSILASLPSANAVIAFGCIIQGNTPHFDYVCKAVTDGIVQLNLQQTIPTIFGILTVLNEQQAIDRIQGGVVGDKGAEAALTALKMLAYKLS